MTERDQRIRDTIELLALLAQRMRSTHPRTSISSAELIEEGHRLLEQIGKLCAQSRDLIAAANGPSEPKPSGFPPTC